jgi:hypothetical protein
MHSSLHFHFPEHRSVHSRLIIISMNDRKAPRECVRGGFFLERGMSNRYPAFFEKMISRCVANMKAVLPLEGNQYRAGSDYLSSLKESSHEPDKSGPITYANSVCLANSVNAVFCNRASILVFRKRKTGMISPHNHGSSQRSTNGIDSS